MGLQADDDLDKARKSSGNKLHKTETWQSDVSNIMDLKICSPEPVKDNYH